MAWLWLNALGFIDGFVFAALDIILVTHIKVSFLKSPLVELELKQQLDGQ